MNRTAFAARRLLLVVCQLLVLLLCTSSALAAGRVEWKSKTAKERDDKSWRLEVAIYMPRPPDVAHVSMKFEFQPVAYYARDLVDGKEGVQERVVPLTDRQSLIESVDVGFMDSGSGKIESRTKFTFKVTRAHGYEAGEYKVTIKDTRNGQTVGTPTTLKFEGENEVVDRRAMVFTGKDKKKDEKKDEAKEGDGDKPADEGKKDESGDSEGAKSEEPAPGSEDSSPADEGAGAEGPPPIEEKPGGCGCRVPGGGAHSSLAAGLALFGLVGLLARRRRLSG